MARNADRDIREANRRKKQLMEAGFRMFSKDGIEAVSLKSVAEAADVGPTTMYCYYKTKANLVAAISADIWGKVWEDSVRKYGAEKLEKCTAYEMLGVYTDIIIGLYRERPEILRFSSNFKTYICREGKNANQLSSHKESLKPFTQLFIQKMKDGSIRTDVQVDELYSTICITMLSVAERYAQGIIWTETANEDYLPELLQVKNMILSWCRADS